MPSRFTPTRRQQHSAKRAALVFGVMTIATVCLCLVSSMMNTDLIWSLGLTGAQSNTAHNLSPSPIASIELDQHQQQHRIARSLEATSTNSSTPSPVVPVTGWQKFKQGFLSIEQSYIGASIEVILVAYLFIGIALVADEYFVESLEIIADKVGMSDDVAGATLMALGCSAPEFFTNVGAVIFSSEDQPNDVGLGTIVGAALFNLFLVIGLCALIAPEGLSLTKGPIIRDYLFYAVAVALLIAFTEHLHVNWWESAILVFLYVLYGIFLTFNRQILGWIGQRYAAMRGFEVEEMIPLTEKSDEGSDDDDDDDDDEPVGLVWKIYYILIIPYTYLFKFTIPNVGKKSKMKNWYPLTFILSLVYLALLTLIMVYLVTRAAYTFHVSTAIIGVIFVSWGTSVPDCLSSLIVARRGMADMAVSNALGSNIFNITMALGFPWLLSTALSANIIVRSVGLVYTTLILVGALLLYGTMLIVGNFQIKRIGGSILVICYLFYTAFQVWAEWEGLNE